VRPVRVRRVLLDGSASPRPAPRRVPRRYWQAGVFSFAGLAIIASTVVIVQHLSLRPQPSCGCCRASLFRKSYQNAIPADSFARAVAFAISQPEDVDANEILFRPTR